MENMDIEKVTKKLKNAHNAVVIYDDGDVASRVTMEGDLFKIIEMMHATMAELTKGILRKLQKYEGEIKDGDKEGTKQA